MNTLEAVNIVLTAVGLPQVSTVSPPGSAVAAQVTALVSDLNRIRQSEGWWFNKTLRKELAPDGGGKIAIAPAILAVEPWLLKDIFSIRNGFLFDHVNDTDIFTKEQSVHLTLLIDFDEVDPIFQEYIAREAALQYHQTFRGDSGSTPYVRQERDRAWAEVKRQDTRNRERNVQYNSHHIKTVRQYRRGDNVRF